MNQTIERIYQEIGQEAISIANGFNGKLLIYAEVEDSVVSADLFYETNQAGYVRFKFCCQSLIRLIQSLWEQWKTYPGNREWRVMCYLIKDGRFCIDLTYPDQIDGDQDLSDRRPLAVEKYFGEVTVDYSNP